jgi:thioredoxin reductase (NADPH)
MAQQRHSRVLIIGAGPAGYTAAIYAARANLKPLLLTGMTPGGQLTITTDVENYPGFADVIQGPWLMEQMQKQAEHVGTEIGYDLIVDIDVTKRPFVATGDSGTIYTADAVIICTGAQAKWLGLPEEEGLRGAGVSACATCDGFFFKQKTVAVIGGGNTAVEEALYLTHHADKVFLVHRRDTLRSEKILQDRLFANPKIEVLWNYQVAEIVAEGQPRAVTALRLASTVGGAERLLPVDGAFVAIGHQPATEVFKGKIELDAEGYIITRPDSTATNIPGIFAAGDVKDKIFRQAVTAAGMGCMSALEVEKYLAGLSVTAAAAAE